MRISAWCYGRSGWSQAVGRLIVELEPEEAGEAGRRARSPWLHPATWFAWAGRSRTAVLAFFGGAGGLAAWALSELFYGEQATGGTLPGLVFAMALWGGLMGCAVGAFLRYGEAWFARGHKGARAAFVAGLMSGALGGALGGAVGQAVYSWMGGGGAAWGAWQVAARTAGWGLFAGGVGAGQGLEGWKLRSRLRLQNGLIGAAMGGLLGGGLFDWIAQGTGNGVVSRAVGLTLVAAAAALGIAAIEEVKKAAWLQALSGPAEGKQFLLYPGESSRIGRSPKCDIVLFHDAQVEPVHAEVTPVSGGFAVADLSGGRLLVNGRPARWHRLRPGDVLELGKTRLRYGEDTIKLRTVSA